jgi:uncharacterized protein YlxW (UPF0749 family)
VGVPIVQMSGGISVDGEMITAPWTISAIGDANRLAEAADVMIQQMRADRRVRQASYRVEAVIDIRAVTAERPFVYANPS